MGTSATVTFMDNGKEILNAYFHYDGYPSYTGTKLGEYLEKFNVGNGITFGAKLGTYANGMGCLAAQFVGDFKEELGNMYLIGSNNNWITDFNYVVEQKENGELVISCYQSGKEDKAYTNTPSQFKEWAKDK